MSSNRVALAILLACDFKSCVASQIRGHRYQYRLRYSKQRRPWQAIVRDRLGSGAGEDLGPVRGYGLGAGHLALRREAASQSVLGAGFASAGETRGDLRRPVSKR